jgi:DNA polymerase (family X)
MDKSDVVRHLKLANDLWAIEGANPYSIRAHDLAADAIAQSHLSVDEILLLAPGSIRGVGRETLAMVRALQTGGMEALLERLEIAVPMTCAELLRLPGIGPKTAHTLVHEYHIYSATDLQQALQESRLDTVPGLGQKRIARLRRDVRVFLERKHSFPVALAWPLAVHLEDTLREVPDVTRVCVTGPLRRLVVMVPRIELVVATAAPERVAEFAAQAESCHQIDEVDARTLDFCTFVNGDKVPVRLFVVPPEEFATVLMQTTGDETHQQVMEGLLHQRGISWSSRGLESEQRDESSRSSAQVIQVSEEAEIYRLIDLPYLPPEVREEQGILCMPAKLIRARDIRGDLHVHSNWSDGSLSIAEIGQVADHLGYEYIAITDHSQSLAIAGGLTPTQLRERRAEIDAVQRQTKARLLNGIEVDILSDGSLDLPDDVLLHLDIVIASVHSSMHQTEQQMTERIVRAIAHPAVHIIGHLTGRILGRRSAYNVDVNAVLDAVAKHGVMLELNANPNRLDIAEETLNQAKSRGLMVPINTDAHHSGEFGNIRYGVRMAMRGGLYREDVLNALPYDDLMAHLQRRRI